MEETEQSQSSVKFVETDSTNQSDCLVDKVNISSENEVANQVTKAKDDVGPKGRQKSKAWYHFRQVTFNGKPRAECIYCNLSLVSGSKNGTTHLTDHLKLCPKKKNQDIKQCLLAGHKSSPSSTVTTLDTIHFSPEVSRKDLAEMVIIHEYPLSMVDHYGFRTFITNLQPMFKIISRNTLKSDILKIYIDEKKKMFDLLNKNIGRIAITCDMWTANHQNRSYMAVIAHFIDNTWRLQHRILRFVYVPFPHTSEVLSKVLEDTFFDWNIDRKLSTMTLDNCSTNDAIIHDIMGTLDKSSLILHGSLFHMRCCAHILNLIVQDGMSVISEEIEKIRESVKFWTASPKREQKFEEAARQLDSPHTKKLALDCKTRWNSTFLMLSTALLYKDVFYRLKRERLFTCLPTEEEWSLAQEICDHLRLFYKATNIFSKIKSPTVNEFFTTICEIRVKLNKLVSSENELVKIMAEKMIVKFEKYWNVVHGIMSVATVLDPRYKMTLVVFMFPKIFGGDSTTRIEHIKNLCVDLYNEYKSKMKRSNKEEIYTLLGKRSRGEEMEEEDALAGFDELVAVTDSSLQEKSELDRYLVEEHLPRNSEFDILAWWKNNGTKYPVLQMIARDIFSVPVSTVASESAFSTGGRIVNPHRSRLLPTTLEALMCGQNWLSWKLKASDGELMNILDDVDDNEVTEICTIVME